jgi:polyferredoxin
MSTKTLIRQQARGFDLLRLPFLRVFVRWKYARLVLQLPLLLLAIFVIWDGLTGRQLASRNIATTASWLHYRGLVVVALALFGNAFCAACPLMLTRALTRRVEQWLPSKLSWPSVLKNKYLVMALLLLVFFSYEYWDLWASPWLTAWLAIAYFVGAFAIDSLFPAGTFCKYVCPLGNFNFLYASASPTQITANDHDICRSCQHKPCLHGRESYADAAQAKGQASFIPLSEITHANGEGTFPGCETKLFVPTMQSNMDCTSCMNCVRACPYDNVAITLRSPAWEWTHAPWQTAAKTSVMVMGTVLAFWGLLNATAMIGPFFSFAEWLARTLNTESEFLLLAVFFLLTALAGIVITLLISSLADSLGGKRQGPRVAFQRWGYVNVALGFGFWGAHYIFHFLTGALLIVPVFQHFFEYRGFAIDTNWRLAQLVPSSALFTITALIVLAYAFLACYVVVRIALRDFGRRGVLAMWPMLLYVLAFSALAIMILGQPMEMRGSIFGASF